MTVETNQIGESVNVGVEAPLGTVTVLAPLFVARLRSFEAAMSVYKLRKGKAAIIVGRIPYSREALARIFPEYDPKMFGETPEDENNGKTD